MSCLCSCLIRQVSYVSNQFFYIIHFIVFQKEKRTNQPFLLLTNYILFLWFNNSIVGGLRNRVSYTLCCDALMPWYMPLNFFQQPNIAYIYERKKMEITAVFAPGQRVGKIILSSYLFLSYLLLYFRLQSTMTLDVELTKSPFFLYI